MKIRINTGDGYDYIQGRMLLEEAGSIIQDHFDPCKVCIITDMNVHKLYTHVLEKSLAVEAFDVYKIALPPGEVLKTLDTYSKITNTLSAEGFSRNDLIIGLGGGTIGDLAGFIAGTFHRGMNLILAPTTLLAAVDSSIGGKNSINLDTGKNQIGTFKDPAMVLFDASCLETLEKPEVVSGLAEILKAGIIGDPELVELLLETDKFDLGKVILQAIERSVEVKKKIVEEDRFDRGLRCLLNLGHTTGHAIEKLSNYLTPHGEAVALGMLIEAKGTVALGLTDKDVPGIIEQVMSEYDINNFCLYMADDIIEAAKADKKKDGDSIRFPYIRDIGDCEIKEISWAELGEIIHKGLIVPELGQEV